MIQNYQPIYININTKKILYTKFKTNNTNTVLKLNNSNNSNNNNNK